MAELNHQEMLRYNRQIAIHGFDFDKQEQLKQAKAIIVGLGGLGCAAAPYLAAAGFGQLLLIDFDNIALSNLQRQILFREQDIGRYKVEVAAEQLRAINPYCKLQTAPQQVQESLFENVIDHYHVVIDCTDNLNVRNYLNRICYQHRRPLISGAAIRMEGLLTSFQYQDNQPCYQCLSHLFGQQTLTCSETGVMSPLVGIIGSMQAMEAIKIVTGFGTPLNGRILLLDALTMQTQELVLAKNSNCEICSQNTLSS